MLRHLPLTGTMRVAVRDDGAPVCVTLIDRDGELLAEVFETDPLFEAIVDLEERCSEALACAPVATFTPVGRVAPAKVWRIDTLEADAVWDEAFQLVYRDRIGSCSTR